MNGSWIHICCDKLFDEFHRMKQPRSRLVMDMQLKQQGVALLCWS